MVAKELAQLKRDRNLVRLLIVAPAIQLLILGFAATTDIREIRLAVRDDDHTWHSRELARALGASGYFKVFSATGPAGSDADLRLDLTDTPEFDGWRWVHFWYPLEHVVTFKRTVYARALAHLAPMARDVAGSHAIPEPAAASAPLRSGHAPRR